jgi:AraC family transcriptional regulator
MNSYPASSFNSVNSDTRARGDVSSNLLTQAPCDQRSGDRSHHRFGGRSESCGLDARVDISPREATERRALAWHGMAVETVRTMKSSRIAVRFHAPAHLLILFEDGVRKEGCTLIEGLPRSELRNYKNKLVFVPSGHEYCDWQEPSHLGQAVYVYIDPTLLPLDTGSASLSPRLFFEDANIQNIALKLKALAEGTEALDRRYCAALGVVLAHELMRVGSGEARTEPAFRGGLAGWQQRAVANYIEEHVADSIPLATLAKVARLSPYHFSRAFKQTFGIPPHRFHTHRRIERAKSLLADPDASVTSVGIAVGFCETSSFSSTFRKATGVTPSRFQRSIG